MDNDQVSNFALQMLESEARGPATASNEVMLHPTPSFLPTQASEQARDISQVEVPQDFIHSIMGDVGALVEEVSPVANPTPLPVAQKSVVESGELVELASLIMEVRVVLHEMKQALTEMTTVGAGLGAPAPSKDSEEDSDIETSLSKILSKRRASLKR